MEQSVNRSITTNVAGIGLMLAYLVNNITTFDESVDCNR